MRGFAGYKDKQAFVKRAPGAIAGRFFSGFPYENGVLLFYLALSFGLAGQRRGRKAGGKTLSAIDGICRI